MSIPSTVRAERWIIQRAGTPGAYLAGWFAYGPDDMGAHFPTWAEAVEFVTLRSASSVQSQEFTDALARWGIARVPAIHAPQRYPDELLQAVQLLLDAGMTPTEIAARSGLSPNTVFGAKKIIRERLPVYEDTPRRKPGRHARS